MGHIKAAFAAIAAGSAFVRAAAIGVLVVLFLGTGTKAAAQTCLPPPSGLAGWWPGDSNFNDIAGGHKPSGANGVSFVPAQVGSGFRFGSDANAEVPHSIRIPSYPELKNQRFTWAAWVRPDGPGPNNDRNGNVILNHHFDARHFLQLSWGSASGRFVFVFGDDSTEFIMSQHTYAPGIFSFVAGAYDGKTLRLYVNGALEGTLSDAKTVPYSSDEWKFGRNNASGGGRTWNGVIDEIQAYNRALSPAEILAIFNAGNEGVCRSESQSVIAQAPDNQFKNGDAGGSADGRQVTSDTAPTSGVSSPVAGGLPGDAAQTHKILNPKDRQYYVWIPPGSFTMGCSEGDTECGGNEKPPHAERIANGFWLAQTEVTQAAYKLVTGGNPSTHKGDLLPVESVTWNEAVSYCEAIGGRLPTEVEWEYAARAGNKWARYGNLDAIAWYLGNSGNANQPVAQKQPNAFGLYDMLGNMWEMVEDSYPGTESKIARGGARSAGSPSARASFRLRIDPARRNDDKGFRCMSGSVDSGLAKPPEELNRTPAPSSSPGNSSPALRPDGQLYVWIPPGAFTMGCSAGDTQCNDNEKPSHSETAKGFWLGRTEVTQAAYQRVTGANPSAHKGDQLPVESVTWNAAVSYCAAIGGRLPTEVEWEYAARGHAGITGGRYGNLDAVAWHSANSNNETHPVALKQSNAFGLFDTLGNVWEWVEDRYAGGSQRILKGGSLFVDVGNVRASSRLVVQASAAANGRGFRCAGDWSAPEATAVPSRTESGSGSTGGVSRADAPGVTKPILVRKVEPEYSEEARKARLKGVVVLNFEIDETGHVVNPRVVTGLGHGLDEKAIEAVKKWKFDPATRNGKPIKVGATAELNFSLL
jgi:TonB family protein